MLNNQGRSMTIHIEALTFTSIIGILDFERTTEQTIVIDILIDYHYKKGQFINYADVIALIEMLIRTKKYKLLEDALEEIQKHLLVKYHQIQKLNIKISKPDIIDNSNVALSLHWSIKS